LDRRKIITVTLILIIIGFIISVFNSFMTVVLLDSVTPENGGMTTAERILTLFQDFYYPYMAIILLLLFIILHLFKQKKI